MKSIIVNSIRALLAFTILTGVIYPLFVTGVVQLITPFAANGSLLKKNGQIIGSELLAQSFKDPRYFWERPSGVDYGTTPSGATNLGPTSTKLKERVATSMKELGVVPESADKPYDLLLTSGSGLDPHITPESARFQVERVAKARSVDAAKVEILVENLIEGPDFGVLGRPRVNVLKLNLALESLPR